MDPTTGLQGLSRRAALCYSKFGNFDEKYPDANMITNMILSDFNIVEIPGWHYKPGEIDMTHLWSYRGKAQPGIPAIDSKFHCTGTLYASDFRTND